MGKYESESIADCKQSSQVVTFQHRHILLLLLVLIRIFFNITLLIIITMFIILRLISSEMENRSDGGDETYY